MVRRDILQNPGQRRRKHKRVSVTKRLLPARPKKAPTAFNLFVKDFFRTPAAKNSLTTAQALARAGEHWTAHPEEHAPYEQRARPGIATYQRNLSGYRKKQELVKKPGNAYVLFLQHLWKTEGNGRSVRDMTQIASIRWRRMSREEKVQYRIRAIQSRMTQSRMVNDINSGRAQLDDFIHD